MYQHRSVTPLSPSCVRHKRARVVSYPHSHCPSPSTHLHPAQTVVDGADQPIEVPTYPGLAHAHVGQLAVHVAQLRRLLRIRRPHVSAEAWLHLCEDLFDVDCFGASQSQRLAAVARLQHTYGAVAK